MSMEASASRFDSSVVKSLYSEAWVVGGAPPFIDACTTRSPSTRDTSRSVASCAMRRRTTGSSRRGSPSREAVRTYSTRMSKRCFTGENVNMVKRSRSRASEMYWNPLLTSPTT